MATSSTPALLLQSFYLIASTGTVLAWLTPAVDRRFLTYGVRNAANPTRSDERSPAVPMQEGKASTNSTSFDWIANIKVPRAWFIHFYLISLASSAFWAHQIITRGRFYTFLESFEERTARPESCVRLVGCWILLVLQAVRRLYESLMLPRSSSQMWVGHFVLGMAFYLATGIAIWIELVPVLKGHFGLKEMTTGYTVTFSTGNPPHGLDQIANVCFWAAFMYQHILHNHLASLKKYTLPTRPEFEWIIAPHYTCECVIYCALSVLSRPNARSLWPNQTMVMALIFVVTNLGVTADGTKEWMARRFGDGSVAGKWRMLPEIW